MVYGVKISTGLFPRSNLGFGGGSSDPLVSRFPDSGPETPGGTLRARQTTFPLTEGGTCVTRRLDSLSRSSTGVTGVTRQTGGRSTVTRSRGSYSLYLNAHKRDEVRSLHRSKLFQCEGEREVESRKTTVRRRRGGRRFLSGSTLSRNEDGSRPTWW